MRTARRATMDVAEKLQFLVFSSLSPIQSYLSPEQITDHVRGFEDTFRSR
jgi:hypothetical protein